jgi:ribosomal 50S subunit-associated protein YjgA (DUF615 family)
MTTTKLLTEQITLAGLRQQAERLGTPNFAKMRKSQLIKAINDAPIVRQTKTPSCEEDRRDCIQELSDWVDQYRAELEKQSSARTCEIESLLNAGDYEAIREWLKQWESEDKEPSSLRSRYREARQELRQERYRQRQRQLYGSVINRITGKASTKSLTRSGADLHSQIDQFQSIGD